MTQFQEHLLGLTCDYFDNNHGRLTPAMAANFDRRLGELVGNEQGPPPTDSELISMLNYVCPPGIYYGRPFGGGLYGFYQMDDYERKYRMKNGAC